MRAQWVCSRERRIALYKRSSISHQSWRWLQRRDWTCTESSPTTPTAATRLAAEGGQQQQAPSPTTVVTSTTTTPTTTQKQQQGLQWLKWRLGDYKPGQPLFRHHYREISAFSPVVSIHPVGWEHIAPPSHTAAASLHLGFTPRFQDHTNTTSATHSEQIDKQHSDPYCAADRRSESSTCKQSQQPTLVDQSESRQVTLASSLLARARSAREEVVVVTGRRVFRHLRIRGSDPCGRRSEHEFWLCRR